MNRLIASFSFAVILPAVVSPAKSQDSKADMLARNGLTMEAKREYIELFHESQSDEVRQSCLYELGRLSLKENDFEAAIFNWRLLLEKFPSSEEAVLVQDHVDLLASRLEEVSHANIENKAAVLYLENGDFHSDLDFCKLRFLTKVSGMRALSPQSTLLSTPRWFVLLPRRWSY